MRTLFFLLGFGFLTCGLAQQVNCPIGVPDVDPCFPGGQAACVEFIGEQLIYPQRALEEGIEGRVILSFVVYCDGSIRDLAVLKSVSPELDQEALRIFSLMPPWQPGSIDGQHIQAKHTFVVSFSLP